MACGCIYIEWTATSPSTTDGNGNFEPSGIYNGYSYYEFIADGTTYFLFVDTVGGSLIWLIGNSLGGFSYAFYNISPTVNPCPLGGAWSYTTLPYTIITLKGVCPEVCTPIQERIEKFYPSINLPFVFEEENRGFADCCDKLLVLGSSESETWKSDVSSAWIKLADVSDTFDFVLLKDGIPVTNYVLTISEFPNEENAFYTTIKWNDVLSLDGAGCYELNVSYSISGIVGDFTWAKYTLLPFSTENALKTARIRVIFNSKQEMEGINFTGARVEDSIRFFGFIGDKQPNTEIDNLIYQDRTMQSVIRENLNTYIITTDPLKDEFISKLTDLYLLSENELFISDYNAHNHSYRILDIPQIVEDTPEINYLDRFQRRAVLTCKTGDKRKNKRTFY